MTLGEEIALSVISVLYYIDCFFFFFGKPFPKQKILDPSKLKEFTDNNLNLMKMAGNSPKWVENTILHVMKMAESSPKG